MAKVYLPEEYLNKPCYQINNGYIRVYETTNNNYYNIVHDVYYTNNYLARTTTASYSSSTICDKLDLTSDFYYRNDFDKILFIFVVFAIFIIYIPFKLFMKLFRGVR